MAKKKKINEADDDRLMELQVERERCAFLMTETKSAHKTAKASYDEAGEKIAQLLYATNHGLPLFEGEAEEDGE